MERSKVSCQYNKYYTSIYRNFGNENYDGPAAGKDPLTLSDSNCENDVANNWVLLVSTELFTSSDIKDQKKILCSLS